MPYYDHATMMAFKLGQWKENQTPQVRNIDAQEFKPMSVKKWKRLLVLFRRTLGSIRTNK